MLKTTWQQTRRKKKKAHAGQPEGLKTAVSMAAGQKSHNYFCLSYWSSERKKRTGAPSKRQQYARLKTGSSWTSLLLIGDSGSEHKHRIRRSLHVNKLPLTPSCRPASPCDLQLGAENTKQNKWSRVSWKHDAGAGCVCVYVRGCVCEFELPLVQDKQSGLFISGKKGVGGADKLLFCSVPMNHRALVFVQLRNPTYTLPQLTFCLEVLSHSRLLPASEPASQWACLLAAHQRRLRERVTPS